MMKIDTLDTLPQLRDSGFGRPSPRHGLKLLYWFAHDYVDININNQMVPKTNPNTGEYGFHPFHNHPVNGDYPLPNDNFPYYEVGNLNTPKAGTPLPQYVTQNFTHHQDSSNKDRIIVQLKRDCLEKIYITEHIDKTNFGRTHQISQDLIANIKNVEREEFLRQMESPQYDNQSYTIPPPTNDLWRTSEPLPINETCCIIL